MVNRGLNGGIERDHYERIGDTMEREPPRRSIRVPHPDEMEKNTGSYTRCQQQ